MNRRTFNTLGLSGIALTALSKFNIISEVSANDELPWEQKTFKYSLGNFKLQSGKVLKDAFLLVDVQGKLNSNKSNAIIYATCYAGSHGFNSMSYGLDRALDPSKYCIITPNLMCSGHSSSPSNTSSPQDGPRFPEITYYDNINAQYKLMTEYFGITNPLMYIGFSMGAQQAFHWGSIHGDITGAVVPVCGTAKTTTQNWLTLEGCKLSLQADAAYNGGDYTSPPVIGLRAFSANYTATLFDKEGFEEGEHLKTFGGLEDTKAYLAFMTGFFSGVDANDLLGMLNTWQYGDIGKHEMFGGDTNAALANIKCPALVMPSATDLSFPARNNIPEVAAMPNAELLVIPSKRGHFAGSMAYALAAAETVSFTDNAIKNLLKRIS